MDWFKNLIDFENPKMNVQPSIVRLEEGEDYRYENNEPLVPMPKQIVGDVMGIPQGDGLLPPTKTTQEYRDQLKDPLEAFLPKPEVEVPEYVDPMQSDWEGYDPLNPPVPEPTTPEEIAVKHLQENAPESVVPPIGPSRPMEEDWTITRKNPADAEKTPNPHPPLPSKQKLTDPDKEAPVPDDQDNEVASEVAKTTNDPNVAKAAAEDPAGFAKAMGWVNKMFGVTGPDLAKFAALYAGSRLAGYSHGGSMGWAFDEAMQDVRVRTQYTQRLTEAGDHTLESVQKFKKTGNPKDLTLRKKTGDTKPTKIDTTKAYQKRDAKGRPVGGKVYKAINPNTGITYWVDSETGERYSGRVADYEDPMTRRELRDEYSKDISGQIGSFAKTFKEDEKATERWNIVPEEASAIAIEYIADAAERNDTIPADSPYFKKIIGNAMREAKEFSDRTGREVNDILPFVQSQMVYHESDSNWANELSKDGKKLDIQEWQYVKNNVINSYKQKSEYSDQWDGMEEKYGDQWEPAFVEAAMEELYEEYNALDPKVKAGFSKRDGFYSWIKEMR